MKGGKMKIRINKKKLITCVIAFLIILNMVACSTMSIFAASLPTDNSMTAGKLIDMCLTRSGKVVNSDMREDIVNQVRNVLNGTATSYKQYLEDNGLQNTTENFKAYLESDAYASLAIRFVGLPLELGSFISWILTGETTLDQLGTDIEDVLTEEDENGNITVPSETVNIINQAFNNIKGEYSQDWTYLDVKPYSELPSALFENVNAYNNAIAYIKSSEYPTLIHTERNNESFSIYFGNNTEPIMYVVEKGANYGNYYYSQYGVNWIGYQSDWTENNRYYQTPASISQFVVTDSETFNEVALPTHGIFYGNYVSVPYTHGTDSGYTQLSVRSYYRIYGKEAGQMIVYHSLQAMKDYSLGNVPYYLTNRQYSDSVDNSFNVSGEYIQNNGGTFAYEQIREQINNSNVTNDSSVSNIVNDYSQTIINNYNYSSGSGDGSNGDDDSGGNSILDGLGSIISAITDIIGFLLGVIGDVIGLVGDLFTTVFEGIKAIGSILGGFSSLLGEIFVFIPQELISFLVLAVESSVGIAIWKKFSK